MSRPGFLATYLGPVVASSPTTAKSIICKLCAKTARSIFWDIPGPNLDAVQIARDLGFTPVRDLIRMRLGHDHLDANIHQQYALVDPGTG
jgi:hypothetical protein